MSEKTALLVMEMQQDYFWEKRLKKFHFDGDAMTAKVNAAIAQYSAAGADIVYIAQIFPDTPTNHLVFGFNMAGSEGAKLDPRLQIVSDDYFEKNTADVFTDEKIRAFLEEKGYTQLILCGIDLCGGILATAKGARAAGLAVTVLADCSATRLDARKLAETKAALKMCGAELK